jgi:hypothetical protein
MHGGGQYTKHIWLPWRLRLSQDPLERILVMRYILEPLECVCHKYLYCEAGWPQENGQPGVRGLVEWLCPS